jgi:anti-anti-sigma factor
MSESPFPSPPSIKLLRPRPGVALVVLAGEHDLSSAPDLKRELDQALGSCDHLIVDISATEFIDSSTLRVLVNSRKHAEDAGSAFNLVLGTAPIVEIALEISKVLPGLNRVRDVEQALAARSNGDHDNRQIRR